MQILPPVLQPARASDANIKYFPFPVTYSSSVPLAELTSILHTKIHKPVP